MEIMGGNDLYLSVLSALFLTAACNDRGNPWSNAESLLSLCDFSPCFTSVLAQRLKFLLMKSATAHKRITNNG